jgi:hypothetical protein
LHDTPQLLLLSPAEVEGANGLTSTGRLTQGKLGVTKHQGADTDAYQK